MITYYELMEQVKFRANAVFFSKQNFRKLYCIVKDNDFKAKRPPYIKGGFQGKHQTQYIQLYE